MTPVPSPFSESALAQVVADHLPPPETATAALLGAVDSSGAQVVVALTSKSGAWTVEAAYQRNWTTGDNAGQVKVLFKW